MNVGIITASDKGYLGEREDRSGARIAEIMEAQGYTVRKKVILPDDQQMLQDEMIAMCNDDIQLILTTGGPVFQTDVTPEATKAVIEREVPGDSHGDPAIFADDHRAGDAVESSGGHPWRDTDRQSAGQSEGCG